MYSFLPNAKASPSFWRWFGLVSFPACMATTAWLNQSTWSRHLATSSRQWRCFNAASQQLYDFPLFHLLWEPLSAQSWDIILKLLHWGAMKMSVRCFKGQKFYRAYNSVGCCYFRKVWLLPGLRVSQHSSDLLPLISCFRHLCSQSGFTWTPTFLEDRCAFLMREVIPKSCKKIMNYWFSHKKIETYSIFCWMPGLVFYWQRWGSFSFRQRHLPLPAFHANIKRGLFNSANIYQPIDFLCLSGNLVPIWH